MVRTGVGVNAYGEFSGVRDRDYEWAEGEVVVFDDSYEHEVWVD